MKETDQSHPEPHKAGHASRLNWLRASVLGANDGIVSIAGLVVGVAGATTSTSVILTAGLAGIVAGAISMAAGEYVSVSSQRDSEKSMLAKEKHELKQYPKKELFELSELYEKQGLKKDTALKVAKELTDRNPFVAHAHMELNIDPNHLVNPWNAAFASALSFLAGACIPLIVILLPQESIRIPITFISVIVALSITGIVSARIGGANVLRSTVRVVGGGILAMIVTYGIGSIFHVSGV